jgi:DNA-binding PadR family transcriptional regulator
VVDVSTEIEEPSSPRLTTTSYAILGLLAVRPWTTYELTRQMDRGLGRIWPRAQSRIFAEPKRLAALGLAQATPGRIGRRPRTVYSITPEGRAALGTWLAQPGAGPVLESEHLVKVFFAEHARKQDTLATLATARRWAEERNEENLAAGRAYLTGSGPFPERAAQTLLVGGFLTEYYRMLAEWADWAAGLVDQWPDDPGVPPEPDPRAQRHVVRRAEWS